MRCTTRSKALLTWRSQALAGAGRLIKQERRLAVLLVLISFLSLLPVALLGAYGISVLVRGETEQDVRRVLEIARGLAQAVDRELESYREKALVLSTASSLQTGNIAAFDALARDAVKAAGENLVLTNEDGQELLNTRREQGAALSKTAHVDATRQVFATGKTVYANLAPSTDSSFESAVFVPISSTRRCAMRSACCLLTTASRTCCWQPTFRRAGSPLSRTSPIASLRGAPVFANSWGAPFQRIFSE